MQWLKFVHFCNVYFIKIHPRILFFLKDVKLKNFFFEKLACFFFFFYSFAKELKTKDY